MASRICYHCKQEVGEGEDTSTKATRDDHDPEDSEQESSA